MPVNPALGKRKLEDKTFIITLSCVVSLRPAWANYPLPQNQFNPTSPAKIKFLRCPLSFNQSIFSPFFEGVSLLFLHCTPSFLIPKFLWESLTFFFHLFLPHFQSGLPELYRDCDCNQYPITNNQWPFLWAAPQTWVWIPTKWLTCISKEDLQRKTLCSWALTPVPKPGIYPCSWLFVNP